MWVEIYRIYTSLHVSNNKKIDVDNNSTTNNHLSIFEMKFYI